MTSAFSNLWIENASLEAMRGRRQDAGQPFNLNGRVVNLELFRENFGGLGNNEIMVASRNHKMNAQARLAAGDGYVRRRHARLQAPRHAHAVRGPQCAQRCSEFLSFLREIDKALPIELDVHCIVDNYATHNHPKVKAWLAGRPRWHMHFVPTYSSWLNQVERSMRGPA